MGCIKTSRSDTDGRGKSSTDRENVGLPQMAGIPIESGFCCCFFFIADILIGCSKMNWNWNWTSEKKTEMAYTAAVLLLLLVPLTGSIECYVDVG